MNAKRWTKQEEEELLKEIKSNPQNLHKCFNTVANKIGRTPGGVSNHWYTKLSKEPDIICFFTASQKHVSRNRKNGAGVKTNKTIWDKFIKILKSIVGL